MTEQKTKPTDESVEAFLHTIDDESKRNDAFTILELMKDITKEKPVMWGPGMIGFGRYQYKYESGHGGEALLTGFSPRKTSLTLYLMMMNNHTGLLNKLGKHKTGKGCLYINKLSDVNIKVLKDLIIKSRNDMLKHIKVSKWQLG